MSLNKDSFKLTFSPLSNLPSSFVTIQFTWILVCLIPGLSLIQRMLTIAGIFAFFLVRAIAAKKYGSVYLVVAITTIAVISVKLFARIFYLFPGPLLQFFSLGIDNDPHIQMFKEFFLSTGKLELISYPKGQQAIWNLFSHLAVLGMDSAQNVIVSYAAMYFLTLISINVAIFWIIRKYSNSNFEIFVKAYFVILVEIFGAFSFMLVGGYPHYLVAFLNVILLFIILNSSTKNSHKIRMTGFITVILYFTCQPFALTTFMMFALLIARNFKTTNIKELINKSKLIISATALVLVGFSAVAVNWAIKTNPLKAVADDAAAEPLSIIHVALSLVIFFIISTSRSSEIDEALKPERSLAVLLILTAFGMSLFTYLSAGEVTYYAVKQVQFVLFFLVIFIVSTVSFDKRKWVSLALTAALVVVQFVPSFYPKVFKGAVMGSGIKAAIHLSRPEIWESQIFEPSKLIQISNLIKQNADECAVFWKPEQLLISKTTWLNAISPAAKHDCQSYQYLEFAPDESEFQMVAAKTKAKFVLIFDASNSPDVTKFDGRYFRLIAID